MDFCQSCAMPMSSAEHFGTNTDLTANTEYCCFCFNDGAFTEELSMEEMIERNADLAEEYSLQTEREFNREEAIAQMRQYFPQLSRWKEGEPAHLCAYFASGCFGAPSTTL
jgi:hypothetical protein